jgi:hypothetical protein
LPIVSIELNVGKRAYSDNIVEAFDEIDEQGGEEKFEPKTPQKPRKSIETMKLNVTMSRFIL